MTADGSEHPNDGVAPAWPRVPAATGTSAERDRCASFARDLPVWLDGDMAPAAAHEMEMHLATCATCAALLASLDEPFDSALPALTALAPSRELWSGIASRIGAPVTSMRPGSANRGGGADRWRVAIAASLLMAATATVSSIVTWRVASSPTRATSTAAAAPAAARTALGSAPAVPNAGAVISTLQDPIGSSTTVAANAGASVAAAGAAAGVTSGAIPGKRGGAVGSAVAAADIATVDVAAAPGVASPSNSSIAQRGAAARTGVPLVLSSSTPAAATSMADVDRIYEREIAALRATVQRRFRDLDTATVRQLQENFRTIDRAIEDSRRALRNDPRSAGIGAELDRTLEAKLELMRRVALL